VIGGKMATKLSKVGNSYSVRIPKEKLLRAGFNSGDELEIIEKEGLLLIFKKKPHHQEWSFDGETSLTSEDQQWLDADFGESSD
jgi:antitoxin component of MazEF toxin-antitoxin module